MDLRRCHTLRFELLEDLARHDARPTGVVEDDGSRGYRRRERDDGLGDPFHHGRGRFVGRGGLLEERLHIPTTFLAPHYCL